MVGVCTINSSIPVTNRLLIFTPRTPAFYAILLGENVDAGLKVFERKARSVDTTEHGTAAVETYVDLLDRIGRHQEAIDIAIELAPKDVPPQRIVPMLIEIASRIPEASSKDGWQSILEYCRKHNDILGYAAVLHASGTGVS